MVVGCNLTAMYGRLSVGRLAYHHSQEVVLHKIIHVNIMYFLL